MRKSGLQIQYNTEIYPNFNNFSPLPPVRQHPRPLIPSPSKYIRQPLDYTVLDGIGTGGIKVDGGINDQDEHNNSRNKSVGGAKEAHQKPPLLKQASTSKLGYASLKRHGKSKSVRFIDHPVFF